MSFTSEFINNFIIKKPSINTILTNIYDNNQEKISVLNGEVSSRYLCLLKFLKKNNIEYTKDKLLLLCFLFKKKFDYSDSNIKLVDQDYYILDSDNRNIQYDLLKKNLFKIILVLGVLWLDIRNINIIKQKPIYKYIFLLLVISVIIGYTFYVYTKDYRQNEVRTVQLLYNKIYGVKSIDKLQCYIENVKLANSESKLLTKMLEQLDIEHLQNYCNISDYIRQTKQTKQTKEIKQETNTEQKLVIEENPVEIVVEAEVVPEVVPEVAQEVVPEVAQEVVPEVAQEVVPEVAQEVVPEVAQEVVPEVAPEVVPEVAQEVVPEVASEVVPEVASEVVPEVAQEDVKETKGDLVNLVKTKQKRQYNKKPKQNTQDKKNIKKTNKK